MGRRIGEESEGEPTAKSEPDELAASSASSFSRTAAMAAAESAGGAMRFVGGITATADVVDASATFVTFSAEEEEVDDVAVKADAVVAAAADEKAVAGADAETAEFEARRADVPRMRDLS